MMICLSVLSLFFAEVTMFWSISFVLSDEYSNGTGLGSIPLVTGLDELLSVKIKLSRY